MRKRWIITIAVVALVIAVVSLRYTACTGTKSASDKKMASTAKDEAITELQKQLIASNNRVTSATQQLTAVTQQLATAKAQVGVAESKVKEAQKQAEMTPSEASKLLTAAGMAESAKNSDSTTFRLEALSGYASKADAEARLEVAKDQKATPTATPAPKPISALSPKQATEAVELRKDIAVLEEKIAKDTGDLAKVRERSRQISDPDRLWLNGVGIEMNLKAIAAGEKRLAQKKEELERILH